MFGKVAAAVALALCLSLPAFADAVKRYEENGQPKLFELDWHHGGHASQDHQYLREEARVQLSDKAKRELETWNNSPAAIDFGAKYVLDHVDVKDFTVDRTKTKGGGPFGGAGHFDAWGKVKGHVYYRVEKR